MDEHDDQAWAERHRRRFFVRAFIFLTLAAVAQASVALPPGPSKPAFYWASLAVLVACALSLLLPWERFPRWVILIPTLAYLVSVTLLLISGGTNPSVQSTAGGLSAVLLPVLGMALYYPRSYAADRHRGRHGRPDGCRRGRAEQRRLPTSVASSCGLPSPRW